MDDMNVWFITGAGRGMGTHFARAALEAGHAVVATGRRTTDVADAVPTSDRLLVAAFDVTSQDDADAAVAAGVERFGRIDVVANSAGGVVQGLLRG
jgi:NAD(P)-dependent dehydrogenase (short-subunit alcohol dehydrogenase family)